MNTFRKWSNFAREFLATLHGLTVNLGGLNSQIEAILEQEKAKQDTTEKEETFPPRIAASVSFESERVNRYYAEYKKRDALDWCLFVLTFFTLFAVAAYAGVAWLQHCDFLESNRINHDALVSVQRAFINYSPQSEVATEITNGRVVAWWPHIPITNSGSTPTRNLVNSGSFYTSAKELTREFSFPDKHKADRSFLGPKDTVTYEIGPIPMAEVKKLYDHHTHIYVYGWATYNDVFPGSKLHRTEFCYELRLNSIPGDVTNPGYALPGRFNLCPEGLHNCADEECDKK